MSVKINGMDKLMAELESKLGKSAVKTLAGQAVENGGKYMLKAMKANFGSFKDTGASIEEMQLTSVETSTGKQKVTIHWKGPKKRYAIIHLNEWGTIKNPSPRGKGVVARTLQSEKATYRKTLSSTLKRGV